MLFRFKHISVISNNFLVEGRYTFFNLPKKLIANYMNYTHPIATSTETFMSLFLGQLSQSERSYLNFRI